MLAQALAPRAVRYFPQIASTNDVALDWLTHGAPSGAIVIADEQTKGRGRLGRTWFAPPGTALLFTVVMRPSQTGLARLTMLGGLAVYEAIQAMGVQNIGVKWANDVQIDRRKVAGVLPEASWEGSRLNGAIIGIGVNVSVDFADSPFADTAISLHERYDQPVDRLDVLKRILTRIDAWGDRLESGAFFDAWRDTLNMIGREVIVDGRRVIAERVDDDGALIVRDAHGTHQRVIAGDILLE